MFARKHKVSADFIEQHDNKVTFRCDHHPGSGLVHVRLRLVRDRAEEFPVSLTLSHVRRTSKGCFIASGILAEGQNPLPAAEARIHPAAVPYRRKRERSACRVRLLSPSLPSYRALSVDFSASGVQIEVDDAISVGSVIPCSLDLPHHENLTCTARVAWCQAEGKAFRAGLEFLKVDAQSFPVLEAFEQWLRSPSSIQKAFRSPPQATIDLPEPLEPSLEAEPEAKPPAGTIDSLSYDDHQARIKISQSNGHRFLLIFDRPVFFCDQRSLAGHDYDDALEVEESPRLRQLRRGQPVPLGPRQVLYHFQFLNRKGEASLEIISGQSPQVEELR
ncbi:MAG: PilZ domain-containing protein [Candidatus Eremiobacteraeota bacterium]|nr:PilZ domain-containing protein [Candidatus Eremiobacteraeota bacterium]